MYSGLTLAASTYPNIKLSTMVTDPYTRHPALTAMAIADWTKWLRAEPCWVWGWRRWF